MIGLGSDKNAYSLVLDLPATRLSKRHSSTGIHQHLLEAALSTAVGLEQRVPPRSVAAPWGDVEGAVPVPEPELFKFILRALFLEFIAVVVREMFVHHGRLLIDHLG